MDVKDPAAAAPVSLDECVRAFEAAAARDGSIDFAHFLPAENHPLYAKILRELVRVDLEFGWQRGQPRPLGDYLQRYPVLAGDAEGLREAAYEEYRQRLQVGETPTPNEYESRYGVSTLDWPDPVSSAPPVSPTANTNFVLTGADPSTANFVVPEGATLRPQVTLVPVLSARPAEVAALLHRHLRLISLGTLGIFAYFALLVLLNPNHKVALFLEHQSLVALNSALLLISLVPAVVLWSTRTPTIRQLRLLELCLVGLILLEMSVGFWCDLFLAHELRQPLAEGDHALFHFASSWSLPFFALIVGYGTLVPSTGRRCAAVVIVVALVPLIISVAAGVAENAFTRPFVVSYLLQMTLWMVAAAAIAAYGAHRLEVLRQEASDARRLGQYRLIRLLGAGGMGEVHLAEHILLRRPCAVKVIHPQLAADPDLLRRFAREAQAAAALTHPNTIQIFDYGTAEDGTFYCAMEYLPGENLHQLVTRHGPQPFARIVHFLRQICGALAEAHRTGLIHRDIKPSNIIVCERGGIRDFVKLLDFGLVVWSSRTDHPTWEGVFGGTPSYTSPEQALGRGDLDARTDLYSLGAVAYFLVTGRAPFESPNVQDILAAHVRASVVPPSVLRKDLPADLERIILRCLEKDPARRYTSADSLEQALAEWAVNQSQIS